MNVLGRSSDLEIETILADQFIKLCICRGNLYNICNNVYLFSLSYVSQDCIYYIGTSLIIIK